MNIMKVIEFEQKVFDSLDNAVNNGYDLSTFSIEEIANDLKEYDSDMAKIKPEKLIPIIRKWRLKHGQ